MRVIVQSSPRRFGLIERIVAVLCFLSLLKGISLLQTNKRQLVVVSAQLISVFGPVGGSPAAAAAIREPAPLLPDCLSLGPHRREFSAKELALQQERYMSWQNGTAQGLAMCLTVKDQAEDLPEWVEYHLGLGASQIYVYDTGSKPPVKPPVQRYIKAGTVTYRYIDDFKAAARELQASNDHKFNPKYKQWIVYNLCLRDHGAKHRFMAFIDSDEFLVMVPPALDGTAIGGTAMNLPALMAQYQGYGGLVANWRVLGANGHKKHQPSTLLAYTQCYPERVPEQLNIKTIINTAFTVQPASPHNAYYAGGCYAVSTAGERVDGFASKRIHADRLLVYHYVTKSLQDFKKKMKRGGGLGVQFRDMAYWDKVQRLSNETCTAAADAWRRMSAVQRQGQGVSQPRRRQPLAVPVTLRRRESAG